jgi:hypothetical protein
MPLGWCIAFTGDIDELFVRTGTMHMFAINEFTLLFSLEDGAMCSLQCP